MGTKNPETYIAQYKKTEPLKDVVKLQEIKNDYPVYSVYQVATKEDEKSSKVLNKRYFALWILNWILFWLLWVSLFLWIYSTNATVVLSLWIMFLVNVLLILIRLNNVLYKEWELIEKTDEDFDFYKNKYVITYYIDETFNNKNRLEELKNDKDDLLVVKKLNKEESERVNRNQLKEVTKMEVVLYLLCLFLFVIILVLPFRFSQTTVIVTSIIAIISIVIQYIFLSIERKTNKPTKEWDYHIIEYINN